MHQTLYGCLISDTCDINNDISLFKRDFTSSVKKPVCPRGDIGSGLLLVYTSIHVLNMYI